ncbi:MAG: hypothetical protein QM783_11750 [Phycisphaerales bacterium]
MTKGKRLRYGAAAAIALTVCSLLFPSFSRVADRATGVSDLYACDTTLRAPIEPSTPKPRVEAPAIPPRPVARPDPAPTQAAWVERLDRLAAIFPKVARGDLFKLDSFCPADFDRDDEVTPADITAFMDIWTRGDDLTGYLADMNHDGVLDQQDVNEFFDAYFKNDCDPKELSDVRLYSC